MQDLAGKSVILRTYEATIKTNLFSAVYVVTDSEIISNEITNHGGNVIMSQNKHDSGVGALIMASFSREVTQNWLKQHGFKYHSLLMGKPRGGNYHWIDNHLVKATRYNGKFTDLVEKEVTIEVFDDGQHD